MRANDLAVDARRRCLPVEVVLDVAEVLGAGVGERDARADDAGQDAGARRVERFAEPGLRCALGEVPARGRPRSGPAGPMVLWPWRPSGSRYFARQTSPRPPSCR